MMRTANISDAAPHLVLVHDLKDSLARIVHSSGVAPRDADLAHARARGLSLHEDLHVEAPLQIVRASAGRAHDGAHAL